MDKMRTIRVTGIGQIRVRPDRTRITLTAEGIYRDYSETLRKSTENTELLKDLLTKAQLPKTKDITLLVNIIIDLNKYLIDQI